MTHPQLFLGAGDVCCSSANARERACWPPQIDPQENR